MMEESTRPEMRHEGIQQGTPVMSMPQQQTQQFSLPQQQVWPDSRPEMRREIVQPTNNPTMSLQPSQQSSTPQQQQPKSMDMNNLNMNQLPGSPVVSPKPSLHQILVTKEVSAKVGSIIGNIIPSIIEWIVSD